MAQLESEIRAWGESLPGRKISTVFIGGGTPSLLNAGQIRHLMQTVRDSFQVEKKAEITMEANPGTVSFDRLKGYLEAGVSRLSFGLQSMQEEELQYLGRIHSREDFLSGFEAARAAGFQNISVDLMSGIPKQTMESFEDTLRKTAKLGPEHISAYGLIIEEGTPFYEMYGEKGREREQHAGELPDEETERKMYHRTREILEGYGFLRYEISNYAKPGFSCRHNLGYWDRTEYLGIGTGAASLIGHERWNQGEEKTTLSMQDEMEEYMFLGLRKMEGVSRRRFRVLFGCEMETVYGQVLENMQKKNLLECAGDFVRLTEFGIDVSNYVMSEFLL